MVLGELHSFDVDTKIPSGCRPSVRALMSAMSDFGLTAVPSIARPITMNAHWWGELMDVGDNALIRGLDAACPILRPGK